MINIINEIKKYFLDANVYIDNINVVNQSECAFGNYIVDIDTLGTTLRITKERGQFFIDLKDIQGRWQFSAATYPEILKITKDTNYNLTAQLIFLKHFSPLSETVQEWRGEI